MIIAYSSIRSVLVIAQCREKETLLGNKKAALFNPILRFENIIVGVPTFSEAHLQGSLDHLASIAEPWLR